MGNEQSSTKRRLTLTACAAVVAAAVGGSVGEARAVDQIQRYCTTSWRNAQIPSAEWPDCTQQTFAELLERIPRDRLVEAIETTASRERRELNRTIWRTIQRWRRTPRLLPLDDVQTGQVEPEQEPTTAADDRSAALQAAFRKLSDRQQHILSQWAEDRTIREIADALNLPAARVSDEKYKALQKLRRALQDIGQPPRDNIA